MTTSQEDLEALVATMVAAHNARDVDAIRSHYAASDEEWAPWDRAVRAFFRAFPDYGITVQRVVLGRGEVALFYRAQGTHTADYPAGELAGVAPTGSTVAWDEAAYYHVENGKIVDVHLVIGGVERLQRLGVLPAPDAAFPD